MNQIENIELSYLAGLIDGDGSIIAQFVYHKDYKKTMPYEIRLTVQVTQLTKRRHHLEYLLQTIGEGSVRDRKKRNNKDQISDYVLVGPRAVSELLKMLVPYLRIKKKQAELVIRICEQLDNSADPAIFDQTLDLVDHVAALNDSKNRENTAQVVRDRIKKALDESSL